MFYTIHNNMRRILFPILLLIVLTVSVIFLQYQFPTFLDLFGNLNKFTEKRISVEVWPLLLTIKLLIIPIIITAFTIRTFCRYIHDSRRSIAKTHFKSSFMYIISIMLIGLFISLFNYIILLYCNKPGRILFFISKRYCNITETKYILNIIFIFTLLINSLVYMISTYLLESNEMKRINKINDMGSLMLDSSYITTNTLTMAIISLIYFCSIALYGYTFLKYLKTVQTLLQPLIYTFLVTTISHLVFAGLYMKYTNIPFEWALIARAEKQDGNTE